MFVLRAFLLFLTLILGSVSFSANNETIFITTADHIFSVESTPQPTRPEQIEELREADLQFENLSISEKVQFQQNRIIYLEKFAQILSNHNIGFSRLVGSVEYFRKVKLAIRNKIKKPSQSEVAESIQNLLQEENTRLESNPDQKNVVVAKEYVAINKLLNVINHNLYKQAKLVSTSDEVGLSLGIGLGASAGVGKAAAGGLADLSFMIGYNRKTKSAVFELHLILERVKMALTPLLMIGIDLRGGLYIQNSNSRGIQKGTSLFTPVMPTAFSKYPNHVDSYLSSGIGFPPMATEFMGYVSQSYRIPLIRIEITFEPKFKIKMSTNLSFFRNKTRTRFKCSALFAI